MDLSDSEPLLAADDLSVSLEEKPILQHLTFTVEAGTWVGLIGPNGSGKTTLLRAINGMLPYTGSLRLSGRPVRAWSAQEMARRIAFVRQNAALAFDFTVWELIRLGRAPHKRLLQSYTRHDQALIERALAQVDLAGFEERSVLSLSGGELQRAFLAQALVQEADVLLLDEPTAHLDVHYQFTFMNQVQALVDKGRTVLAVFHDLELASRYAGRLLTLDQEGHLAAAGTPSDVLTPALIASVFRMEANITDSRGGGLRIDYLRPVVSESAPSRHV